MSRLALSAGNRAAVLIAVTGAFVIGACGGGSGSSDGGSSIDSSILGETLARDISDQYDKSSVVRGCRETGARTFECVAREEDDGTQALLTVRLEKSGRYRATSSITGVVITGAYPNDTAFRGIDGAALMREVFAQGKRQGQIPAGAMLAEPACEINQQEDRSYDCYLPDPTGQSTRQVIVGVDGSFRVPDVEGVTGNVAFSGQLPKSFR